MSEVWKYFIKSSTTSAKCLICNEDVPRRGNTTNLLVHLKKHPNKDKALQNVRRESEETDHITGASTSKNITAQKSVERCFKECDDWTDHGPKTKEIDDAIAFMVVKDYQPISIVEDEGFINLLKLMAPRYRIPQRRLITRIIDEKYEKTIRHTKEAISNSSLTLTADIWTDSHTTRSYLGMTCYYFNRSISKDLQSVDLGVYPLYERHQSSYISSCFEETLKKWEISMDQVSVVVTDHAANMVKAVADTFSSEKHIGCAAHAVNLVAKKAIDSAVTLANPLEKVKKIVAFFRRSTTANDNLQKKQTERGKTPLRICSFVPTRWNSELFMLKRFLELYEYIECIMKEQDRLSEMVSHGDKRILEEVVQILEPLNEVTEDLSGEKYSTLSRLIPLINCLTKTISDIAPKTTTAKDLKSHLLNELENRFSSFKTSSIYAPSTLLDPRFKDLHLNLEEVEQAKNAVIQTILADAQSDDSEEDCEGIEPQTKVVKRTGSTGIWNYHQGMVQQYQNRIITSRKPDSIRKELALYLASGIESMDCNVFQYWESKRYTFPLVYNVAMKLLPLLVTSVPSERLFSKAGRILCDSRSSLNPERVNRIAFLHNVTINAFKSAK